MYYTWENFELTILVNRKPFGNFYLAILSFLDHFSLHILEFQVKNAYDGVQKTQACYHNYSYQQELSYNTIIYIDYYSW